MNSRAGNTFALDLSPDVSDHEDDGSTGETYASREPRAAAPSSASTEATQAELTKIIQKLQLERELGLLREGNLKQQLATAHLQAQPPSRRQASVPAGHPTSIPTPPASASSTNQATSVADSLSSTTNTDRAASSGLEDIPDDYPGKIHYLPSARKGVILGNMFPNARGLRSPLLGADLESPRRFVNDETKAMGHVGDFWGYFPAACHNGLRGHHKIQNAVIKAANDRRHQATHAIRTNFSEIFLDLPEGTRTSLRDKKWEDSGASWWLKGETTSWDLNLPPIYYPSGRFGKKDAVYRAPWLLKAARVVLYAKTALCSELQLEPSDTSDGKRWDADITPGLIALSCVLVRYVIGPDSSFTAKGRESKHDYVEEYFRIKDTVLKSLLNNRKWGLELIEYWRKGVLAPSKRRRVLGESSVQPATTAALAEDEAAMRALEESFDQSADDMTGSMMLSEEPLSPSPLHAPASTSARIASVAPAMSSTEAPAAASTAPQVPVLTIPTARTPVLSPPATPATHTPALAPTIPSHSSSLTIPAPSTVRGAPATIMVHGRPRPITTLPGLPQINPGNDSPTAERNDNFRRVHTSDASASAIAERGPTPQLLRPIVSEGRTYHVSPVITAIVGDTPAVQPPLAAAFPHAAANGNDDDALPALVPAAPAGCPKPRPRATRSSATRAANETAAVEQEVPVRKQKNRVTKTKKAVS